MEGNGYLTLCRFRSFSLVNFSKDNASSIAEGRSHKQEKVNIPYKLETRKHVGEMAKGYIPYNASPFST